VVASHLVLGHGVWLTAPSKGGDVRPAVYNLPFIRAPFEGYAWVSFFLVLTGFVNALKPIKQARDGRVDAALSGLASSCLRRTSRLVLPCTIATFFSWILCEVGAFEIGAMTTSEWMRETCPRPSGSVWAALHSLGRAIYETWTSNNNVVDRNQWVMLWFLKGSLMLYAALLATSRAVAKYRMLIFVGLLLYSWETRDSKLS
jgi:hypothetical protein